ncbi:MAG: protein kinase [Myxococcaceae bacterium]|nr:protein kinase [Myxococcaceae bacterium]
MTQFGKYELTTRLAKGGMGETYLAQLNAVAGVSKRVVIKKMLPSVAADEKLVEAFIQEARISATLSHGNIAQVFDFGSIDGEYFLAMEYVHGQSLQGVMKRAPAKAYPRLPFEVTAYVAIELLKALHYAHTRVGPNGTPLNLIHRDVTPDNILVSYEGDVKLVDFGVAKAELVGRAETEPGLVKGKYRYFSPEQAVADPLDARSDIFAVGIVLHELFAGEPLFTGQMHQVMNAIVRSPVPRLSVRAPDVPEALVDVVDIALSRNKADRFPTALAMQEALSRWLYSRTPDFTGDVLRELMGELFGEELAKAGTPFVAKRRATGVLRALKSQTSAPGRPAVKRNTDHVETSPGRAAVQPLAEQAQPPSSPGGFQPVSTTQPSARAARASLFAAAVLLVIGAAGVVLATSSAGEAGEDECVRIAETALELGVSADDARAALHGCLGERSPTAISQRLLNVIDGCAAQLTAGAVANRAIEAGDFQRAERTLGFRALPCAARQRGATERRLAELMPSGVAEEECLKNGQTALEGGSPATAARVAVTTCLNGRAPSATAKSALEKYELCAAQLTQLADADRAILEDRLEAAHEKLKAEMAFCAKRRHAEVRGRLAMALERRLEDGTKGKVAVTAASMQRPGAVTETLIERARASLREKKFEEAKQLLYHCVRIEPKNAECWKFLGVTLGQSGDGAGGARAYEKFVELAPNHPQANKVRQILDTYRAGGFR